jgi:aldehyde:ferredoxin oxidoreductase
LDIQRQANDLLNKYGLNAAEMFWGELYLIDLHRSGILGPVHYIKTLGRHFDKNKFEEFKTRFYRLQGWDVRTGYPSRETLESLDLGYVADELKKNDRLGRG